METKDGLRCSANTSEVRPFWRRTLAYYGGTAFALYSIGVLTVFIFLRTVGYPVSIVHVGLPPLWDRVGQARGWFFLDRSNRAFAEGRTSEGLLYLANSYEFDPNYTVGLSLAKNFQIAQPAQSDRVFNQLLRDHPDKRHETAQHWFLALLARGSFDRIIPLAREELLTDPKQAAVWIRALLLATTQARNDSALRELATHDSPAARIWRQLLQTELLVRAGRTADAKTALERPWPIDHRTRFTLYYRVSTLIDLRDSYSAVDLLQKYPNLLDEEAKVTLLLAAFAAQGSSNALRQEVDRLLAPRLTLANLSIVKIVCAQLIRYPDTAIFERLWLKIEREAMPMNADSVGVWFSLLCAAGAVGDKARLHELTVRLKQASQTPFVALDVVETFFRGELPDRRITAILPILPLPREIYYALIERYTPASIAPGSTPKRR